jgi:hypothetical protein
MENETSLPPSFARYLSPFLPNFHLIFFFSQGFHPAWHLTLEAYRERASAVIEQPVNLQPG